MKFFLCDDQEQMLDFYEEKLLKLAEKHNRELEICRFKSGRELLFHFEDIGDTVDAIYMDINMPEIDGVSVSENLRKDGYSGEIIFLTVSEEHFLPAFDVGAFNYILKEKTTSERFEEIFLKVLDTVDHHNKECILLSSGGAHRKIELADIHYFEVRKRIVTVYYGEETFEFYSTLEKLENQLLGKGFYQVNRAYLVAEHSIKEYTYETLYMNNGDAVPIGRSYQKVARQYFKERFM